jgi:NAD-dependent DNA ligase
VQQTLVEAQVSFDRETALRSQLEDLTQEHQQLVQQTTQQAPQLNRQIEELTTLNSQLTEQLKTAQETIKAQTDQTKAAAKEQAAMKEALEISQSVIASLQKQTAPAPPSTPSTPAPSATSLASEQSANGQPTEQADDMPPVPSEAPVKAKGLNDKSFVITGTLKALTYEQITQRITDAGGRINKMPSGKTDYIVVGKNPGSKLKKAEKYNTPQLNESQLLDLLDGV